MGKMRSGGCSQCVVVWITAREIIQGCSTGTWVDVGCSFGPARNPSPVGGDHKSHTLWGNEMPVAAPSVGNGNGCSPEGWFGRGEGFALSFPSTHESHHRREKSIQLSVLHPQGSSLLFPHSFGENVPLDETQG